MLPTSHLAPRNASEPQALFAGRVPAEASMLADAFSEFIAAAARLESSYSELQEQVAQLGVELAERNTALNASLAENERMRLALQGIVDSMPCGVLVLERNGALSMLNPEGLRLLELEPAYAHRTNLNAISAHIGIDLGSLVGDDRVPEGEQEFSLPGTAGKRWIEVRNRRLYARAGAEVGCTNGRKSGARVLGRASARRGRWSQTILILRDITAHKQAEQERERGRRATALAEVAAMLAHEIRNPLASLELFAGLLAESPSLEQASGAEQQWIAHMRAGIRSLSGTVNNVLSFHGAGFPSLEPLDLEAAIASSVEFVRPIAEQAGIHLSLAAQLSPKARGDAGSTMVLGNASALQQLVLNLVSNAVRHTPQSGRIEVSLRSLDCGRRAAVAVADTGCGIAREHLSEIFRAGFSGGGDSSGLGLAVCSQIVRQHEGTIRVESEPGGGATFLVELPTL